MLSSRIWQRTARSLRRRWFSTYVSQTSSQFEHKAPFGKFYSPSAIAYSRLSEAKYHINVSSSSYIGESYPSHFEYYSRCNTLINVLVVEDTLFDYLVCSSIYNFIHDNRGVFI